MYSRAMYWRWTRPRIKAGREAKGKMRTGWLWPVYGDAHEVVFHYARSRAHRHVHAFLGNFRGTLLSDGYDGVLSLRRAATRGGNPRSVLVPYPQTL